jgi:hypothetical protein
MHGEAPPHHCYIYHASLAPMQQFAGDRGVSAVLLVLDPCPSKKKDLDVIGSFLKGLSVILAALINISICGCCCNKKKRNKLID